MRTHYSRDVTPKIKGKNVVVAGWVQTVRQHGNVWFIKVRDREGTVQLTLVKGKVPDKLFTIAKGLTPESVISAKGIVQVTGNVVEVVPSEIDVLNKAQVPLPLDISGKIESELDTRLTTRFMDLRQTKTKAIFMVRDCVVTAIHNFLDNEGFVEVHTPKIVIAGAEGGATLFPLEYFGKKAFLAQSPQLFKQVLMSTGFDKIYEIGPAFRAEKSATTRHLAQSTMLDIEIAFTKTDEELFKIQEDLVVAIIKHVKKHSKAFLEELGVKVEVPKTPFKRIPYEECIKILQKQGKKIKEGNDIDPEGERVLGKYVKEKYGEDYFFLQNFPLSVADRFYDMKTPDGKHAYYSDLEQKGQELTSGSIREHRYDILLKQIKAKGLNPEDLAFYLNAFKYGMPPHCGLGLGIDRFVQKLLDLPNIREAVLFPRDVKRLIP